MTDRHDIPGKRPRRAEPLQPDKPASGQDAESASEQDKAEPSSESQKTQSETALDNVREGYG